MIGNNNAGNCIVNNKSSSSSSGENLGGQIDGRPVVVGEGTTDRAQGHKICFVRQFSPELMARIASVEVTDGGRIIIIDVESQGELVEEYMTSYGQGDYGSIMAMRIGHWDSNGKLCNLHQSIYDRLSKTGLILKSILGTVQEYVTLPLLGTGNFNIVDPFGWFCRDSVIEQKFYKIAQGFRILLSLEKICYHKIEKFDDVGEVTSFNHINQRNVNSKQTGRATGGDIRVIHNEVGLNQKERMQLKLKATAISQKKTIEDKIEVLGWLERWGKVWGSVPCDLFQPNKVYAYMLFEAILNHVLDIWCYMGEGHFNKNVYKAFIEDHLQRAFRILTESLEMLLPYATEITEAFEIDLKLDKRLFLMIATAKKQVSRLSIDEYKEYQDLEVEVAEIFKTAEPCEAPEPSETPKLSKKARARARKRNAALLAGTVSAKKDEQISLCQSQQAVEEVKRKEQVEANRAVMTQRARNLQAAREDAERERRFRGKEKVKELNDRKASVAQDAVNKHKEEEVKKQETEIKARTESQGKIHDLPSEDFVQNMIIGQLNGHDALIMKMVFNEVHNDKKISHVDVLNLALHIKDILEDNNIGCAKDFYNYVVSRIHRSHRSDTGNKHPAHYLRILCACFVIFGIFPKDWKPKTKEDFDAMEKFLQRQLDAFYAKVIQ